MNDTVDCKKKNNHFNEEIFDSIPVALFIISKAGEIKFVNTEGRKLTHRIEFDLFSNAFDLLLEENSKLIFHQFIDSICINQTKQTCLVEMNLGQNQFTTLTLHGNLSIETNLIQLIAIETLKESESKISYQQEFEDISNVAIIGRWELNFVTGKLVWSQKIYEIFFIFID